MSDYHLILTRRMGNWSPQIVLGRPTIEKGWLIRNRAPQCPAVEASPEPVTFTLDEILNSGGLDDLAAKHRGNFSIPCELSDRCRLPQIKEN